MTLSEGYFDKRESCWKVLRPLQKRAVDFCAGQHASALLFKQRLGKTYIAAGVIERLRPQCTLIIVPLTNKRSTWRKKLAELVPHIPACMTQRKGKKALMALLKAFSGGILVLHFEEVSSVIKLLRRMTWDLIIVDESQRAKDRASLFSRSLAKLRDSIARKIILTGTPLEDQPQDLWAQFRFLSPDVFGTRWADFDLEYIEQPKIDLSDRKRYPPGSVRWRRALMRVRIMKRTLKFRADKLKQFVKLIKPYCWREELPSPEPKFHTIDVRMEPYQQYVYDNLQKNGYVKLRDGTRILPPIEIAKRMKLRQITSGFIFDEDKGVHWLGDAKEQALLALLKTLPKPVVIFCLYVPEIERLAKVLPGKVRLLYGGIKDRERRVRIQEKFQRGDIDYLLVQTRTGGIGIDLYRAKALVVVSGNYSSIDFDQVISRIRLPEQKKPVNIFLLIASGTIDAARQSRVFAKDRRVQSVLQQLRR